MKEVRCHCSEGFSTILKEYIELKQNICIHVVFTVQSVCDLSLVTDSDYDLRIAQNASCLSLMRATARSVVSNSLFLKLKKTVQIMANYKKVAGFYYFFLCSNLQQR